VVWGPERWGVCFEGGREVSYWERGVATCLGHYASGKIKAGAGGGEGCGERGKQVSVGLKMVVEACNLESVE